MGSHKEICVSSNSDSAVVNRTRENSFESATLISFLLIFELAIHIVR